MQRLGLVLGEAKGTGLLSLKNAERARLLEVFGEEAGSTPDAKVGEDDEGAIKRMSAEWIRKALA